MYLRVYCIGVREDEVWILELWRQLCTYRPNESMHDCVCAMYSVTR